MARIVAGSLLIIDLQNFLAKFGLNRTNRGSYTEIELPDPLPSQFVLMCNLHNVEARADKRFVLPRLIQQVAWC